MKFNWDELKFKVEHDAGTDCTTVRIVSCGVENYTQAMLENPSKEELGRAKIGRPDYNKAVAWLLKARCFQLINETKRLPPFQEIPSFVDSMNLIRSHDSTKKFIPEKDIGGIIDQYDRHLLKQEGGKGIAPWIE